MIQITRMEAVHGHPWVRAVAEVEFQGLRLRGLKLEEHPEGWKVTPPGRRIQGRWQFLFSIQDPKLEKALLASLRLRHG